MWKHPQLPFTANATKKTPSKENPPPKKREKRQ